MSGRIVNINIVPTGYGEAGQALPATAVFTFDDGQSVSVETVIPPGLPGKSGTSWHVGYTEPTASAFISPPSIADGDLYLATQTSDIFKYNAQTKTYTFQQKLLTQSTGLNDVVGSMDGTKLTLSLRYADGGSRDIVYNPESLTNLVNQNLPNNYNTNGKINTYDGPKVNIGYGDITTSLGIGNVYGSLNNWAYLRVGGSPDLYYMFDNQGNIGYSNNNNGQPTNLYVSTPIDPVNDISVTKIGYKSKVDRRDRLFVSAGGSLKTITEGAISGEYGYDPNSGDSAIYSMYLTGDGKSIKISKLRLGSPKDNPTLDWITLPLIDPNAAQSNNSTDQNSGGNYNNSNVLISSGKGTSLINSLPTNTYTDPYYIGKGTDAYAFNAIATGTLYTQSLVVGGLTSLSDTVFTRTPTLKLSDDAKTLYNLSLKDSPNSGMQFATKQWVMDFCASSTASTPTTGTSTGTTPVDTGPFSLSSTGWSCVDSRGLTIGTTCNFSIRPPTVTATITDKPGSTSNTVATTSWVETYFQGKTSGNFISTVSRDMPGASNLRSISTLSVYLPQSSEPTSPSGILQAVDNAGNIYNLLDTKSGGTLQGQYTYQDSVVFENNVTINGSVDLEGGVYVNGALTVSGVTSFQDPPTIINIDYTPVNADNANQLVTKAWVDRNYIAKDSLRNKCYMFVDINQPIPEGFTTYPNGSTFGIVGTDIMLAFAKYTG